MITLRVLVTTVIHFTTLHHRLVGTFRKVTCQQTMLDVAFVLQALVRLVIKLLRWIIQ